MIHGRNKCPQLPILLPVCFALLTSGSTGQSPAKSRQAKDELPASVVSFNGVALLAPTNAQGALLEVAVQTSSSRYLILTNSLTPAVIQQCIKLHDKPVGVKGEVSAQGQDLCLKLIGPIRDMTPSLAGVLLCVTTDPNGKFLYADIIVDDPRLNQKFAYSLTLPKNLTEEEISRIIALNGKKVNIEGEISHSTMSVYVRGPIRASGSSQNPKQSQIKKKVTGK